MDLHHAGSHRDAHRVLDDLLAVDRRCVDAWARLTITGLERALASPTGETATAPPTTGDKV